MTSGGWERRWLGASAATRARQPASTLGATSANRSSGSPTARIAPSLNVSCPMVFADVARLVPDRREHVHPGHLGSAEQRAGFPGSGLLLVAGVGRPCDQREHPGDSLGGDPAGDPRGQRLLSLPQRRADDPPDPVTGRRFDPLALQVCQQLYADLVCLPLLLAPVRRTHITAVQRYPTK